MGSYLFNGKYLKGMDWDCLLYTSFAVFPEIVLQKELPILFEERFDEREAVGGELLVLRGVGIIEGPLSEGKISADEIQEPADSIILFLNYSK